MPRDRSTCAYQRHSSSLPCRGSHDMISAPIKAQESEINNGEEVADLSQRWQAF